MGPQSWVWAAGAKKAPPAFAWGDWGFLVDSKFIIPGQCPETRQEKGGLCSCCLPLIMPCYLMEFLPPLLGPQRSLGLSPSPPPGCPIAQSRTAFRGQPSPLYTGSIIFTFFPALYPDAVPAHHPSSHPPIHPSPRCTHPSIHSSTCHTHPSIHSLTYPSYPSCLHPASIRECITKCQSKWHRPKNPALKSPSQDW